MRNSTNNQSLAPYPEEFFAADFPNARIWVFYEKLHWISWI